MTNLVSRLYLHVYSYSDQPESSLFSCTFLIGLSVNENLQVKPGNEAIFELSLLNLWCYDYVGSGSTEGTYTTGISLLKMGSYSSTTKCQYIFRHYSLIY